MRRLAISWPWTKAAKLFLPHRYRLNLDGRLRFLRASRWWFPTPPCSERPNFLYGPPETLADRQAPKSMSFARAR